MAAWSIILQLLPLYVGQLGVQESLHAEHPISRDLLNSVILLPPLPMNNIKAGQPYQVIT